MKNTDMILEGLQNSRPVNEAFTFRKFYGCALTKDFGELKKGTKFYCDEIIGNRVKLSRQDDKGYQLILPIKFASDMFGDVSGLTKGKTYVAKVDIPYMRVEDVRDWEWSEDFIQNNSVGDMIVFEKGTKFKYIGADMSGDFFEVDGVEVPMSDVSMLNIRGVADPDYEDIFKM